MTIRLLVATLLGALLFSASASGHAFAVTLRIVDDDARPVPGATAQVSFDLDRLPGQSLRIGSSRGVSDAEGQLHLEGKTTSSGISYGAEKAGYYGVQGYRYNFKDVKWLHWEPQNPTIEVVLKRIKNPVPMYAKRIWGKVLKPGGSFSYDFEAGDWVAPLGKGKVPDIVFAIASRSRAERDFDWDMTVTFSKPGDGIQRFSPDAEPASFRSPYEAPLDGYLSEWKLKRWRRPGEAVQTTLDDKGGYFFRVRTELDHEGKVVKALYGKIYGDFFSMVHYLNPDGTRNMEYDSKRNLLKYPDNWTRNDYDVSP